MVRDKPAQLVLQRSMGPAGGRHRLRLSVHELPQTAIPRVPNEKFRDGHPDRYLGNRTHDFRLARKDDSPNECQQRKTRVRVDAGARMRGMWR